MDISTEARDLLKAKIKTALQPIFTEALSEIVAEIDPATAIAAHVGSAPAPHGTNGTTPRSRPPRSRRSSKRVRRSPTQLAADASAVEAFVKANPGKGVNDVAKGTDIPVTKLRSIMQMLRADARIGVQGTKVHTTYWPAAAQAAPKATRKAAAAAPPKKAKAAGGPGVRKARRRTVAPPAVAAPAA